MKKSMKQISKISITLLIIAIVSGYFILRSIIKSDINESCEYAMNKYEGDKIEALLKVIKSDDESLKTKNNSIWALGKLRDKRAIPTLKKFITHQECDHNYFVCQRELNKAINTLEGKNIDIMIFK